MPLSAECLLASLRDAPECYLLGLDLTEFVLAGAPECRP